MRKRELGAESRGDGIYYYPETLVSVIRPTTKWKTCVKIEIERPPGVRALNNVVWMSWISNQ